MHHQKYHKIGNNSLFTRKKLTYEAAIPAALAPTVIPTIALELNLFSSLPSFPRTALEQEINCK